MNGGITRLIRHNALRRRGRALLTLGGVASAMLLLVLVESLSEGFRRALSGSEAARTLVVYRQNRYCPQTSFLPERYTAQIERIEGVRSVLPVKVFLNNCRASLDLVAFQGAPIDRLFDARELEIVAGDPDRFRRQHDAALLGRAFAERRGLSPGDKFRLGNVTVDVAGVFASPEPVEEGVILTHLEFLQRAGPVDRLGTVTQFEVQIEDAGAAERISREIDALFATAEEPTDTRSKLAFLESATRDLQELLGLARWLGLACVLVALALVGNTVLMAVHERRSEFAVLRTLGYRAGHVVQLVLGEALALAAIGAALGVGAAFLLLQLFPLAIGVEGVSVEFRLTWEVVAAGAGLALATGVLAGIAPAVLAAREPIAPALAAS